ncbi:MAG TPA: hypothetical protein VH349_11285 [Ktedonobacterales bacterium]|jgi:hypothetical protein
MENWTAQSRPAPQFEQQQVVIAPSMAEPEPPDLDDMAQRLDQMKIEAIVDAERTRFGINGLFAFLLVTPMIYLLEHLIVFQGRSFDVLTDAQVIVSPERVVIALAAGLGVAVIVAIASQLARQRVTRAVKAYEARLIALGGTPLPERGVPLEERRRDTNSRHP